METDKVEGIFFDQFLLFDVVNNELLPKKEESMCMGVSHSHD